MRLRYRLFGLVSAVVAVTVSLVTWTISSRARRSFEAVDAERRAALTAQFRREFDREGEEVVRRLARIAASDAMVNLTMDLVTAPSDYARYVNEAEPLAAAYGLDFLDVVAADGIIVSSAHWPSRFGRRHAWAAADAAPHAPDRAFLQPIELPNETALGLVAVRDAGSGTRHVRLAGGRRLDRQFLSSLVLPPGMRALLSRHVDDRGSSLHLVDASGPVTDARELEPLITRVRGSGKSADEIIRRAGGSEAFEAIPLPGLDGRVLGVLLVGSSDRELASLVRAIRLSGVVLGGLGVLFGLALSYVLAARVTRPVEQLAGAARTIADGRWDAAPHVGVRGASREIASLATAFDTMARQLVEQRDRLMQAERVAAWRELARRLAHELKNPLFPLTITVDNLRRAKSLPPDEFDEVFAESVGALSTGLGNLNTVIARFSDFARMPSPALEPVDPAEIVSRTMALFRAQLESAGRPPIRVTVDVSPQTGTIRADPEQLGRLFQNLLLNAIDAMPGGGEIRIAIRRHADTIRLDVSDTGSGLTAEERARLFTPYYTTKQHGTGLGLAIVQSVVADHGGRISVESEPGRGTTFHIELPTHD
jgi:signal transduction histidine kinase